MIDEKYIEWMHLAIDGKLSRKDREKLDVYLQSNAEAREFFEQLLRTVEILDHTEEIEPPDDLKQRIMSSIDFSRYAAKEQKASFAERLTEWFYRPQAKLVYAFAAGLLLGLLALSPFWFKYAQPDVTDLSGTIGVLPDNRFRTIEEIPVQTSGLAGTIEIKKYQQFISVNIHIKTINTAQLTIEFDPGLLQWNRFIPQGAEAVNLKYKSNTLTFLLSSSTEMSLFFRQLQPDARLTLRLIGDGNLVVEKTLVIE